MKLNNNLLIINKMILFYKNLIEEDIDFELFLEQIYNNCININITLDDIWDEFLKRIDEYKSDNIIKTYYFTLKRFQNYIFEFNDKIKSSTDKKLLDSIKNIIKNNQNRINLIRDNKFKIKSGKYSKQFINEEEYSLLLKDLNNEL